MHPIPPTVSLGLPVFNGEAYLDEALRGLLTQTWRDFELIICDNASTDRTGTICRRFADADPRIRYVRSASNLGAAVNYNRCFELATGRYFKWCAHDDVCLPDYLSRCVALLDAHPDTVLAYPRTIIIDAAGHEIGPYEDAIDLDAPSPSKRLFGLFTRKAGECNAVFGLIRVEALRKTGLIGNYVASDENLLGELALLGPLRQVPEPLFLRRDHAGTSLRANPTAGDVARWFDSSWQARTHLPMCRQAVEYLRSALRLPMPPAERLRVLRVVARWSFWHKDRVGRELARVLW